MDTPEIYLDTVDDYNKAFGLETLHPLVTVANLNNATLDPGCARYHYGLYALFLKNGVSCTIQYGRKPYDYQEGSIVSFAPGQVVDVVRRSDYQGPAHDVRGLLFHPDIIFGTPLADKIDSYGFFNYTQAEALHLSAEEKALFLDCLDKIDREMRHPVDKHSAALLSANIQLLLEYLNRFYDRQFITRHKANTAVVAAFEQALKEYYAPKAVSETPRVSYFADRANLSAGYFGDLIKRETGSTAQDLITLFVVNEAKRRLAASEKDIAEIAYDLGFQYPQHFTRLFKRVTGQNPTSFRASLN